MHALPAITPLTPTGHETKTKGTTMELWKQAKQFAKALRPQLGAIDAENITHGNCLNIVSRMQGSADWNTYFVKVQRRYFYDKHSPYLPNDAEFVRAMSVRRSVLVDLAHLEAQTGKAGKKESGPAFFTLAIERAMRQAHATFKGKVLVAPSLMKALEAPSTKTTVGILNDEEFAFQSMNGAMLLSNTDSYSSYLTQTDQVAAAYSETYLQWRLATLTRAWARCLFKQNGKPSLSELLASGADLFDVAGDIAEGRSGFAPDTPKHTVNKYNRLAGKTVLLSLLANGSMEESLRMEGGITLDGVDELAKKLLARFPEIELWQAWVELKPLLAEGVDSVVS
jgi:hypothetical protein